MGELIAALEGAGLRDVAISQRFDPFQGTSKESVARKYGVIGVNVFGRREGT